MSSKRQKASDPLRSLRDASRVNSDVRRDPDQRADAPGRA